MKLRSKLILAFLLLSVLPLSAVTLYSYRSSLDAFHRTAETQSGLLASEMGQRMELVTAEISQRVDQFSKTAPEPPLAAKNATWEPNAQAVQEYVTKWLGNTTPFLDRLEFVPSAPNPDPDYDADPNTPAPPMPPPPPARPERGRRGAPRECAAAGVIGKRGQSAFTRRP